MSLKKFLSGIAIAAMVAVPMVSSASQPSNTQPVDPIIQITNIKTKSVSIDQKFKKCIADAKKREQQAPPVDPVAVCKGKVKVAAEATAMAKCPDGSAKATAKASVHQWVTVFAKSQAIASGRAEAHAKTIIRDRVKAKAKASVKCYKKIVPNQPTPPSDDGDCNDCDGGDNTTVHRTRNVTVVSEGSESYASEKGVEELPNTGPEAAIFGAFGSGAMGVGIRSFIRSRKGLASALLG